MKSRPFSVYDVLSIFHRNHHQPEYRRCRCFSQGRGWYWRCPGERLATDALDNCLYLTRLPNIILFKDIIICVIITLDESTIITSNAAYEQTILVLQQHDAHRWLYIFFLHCAILHLFNHNLSTIIHIYAALRRFTAQLATVEAIPCASQIVNCQLFIVN